MTVSAWETDTSIPRVSLRPKLWAALGLTPDDFDPPPDGGRRRKSPTPNSRVSVQSPASLERRGAGMTWGELATAAVNALEANLPLSVRRDLERGLCEGLRQVESERPDLAERLRSGLATPDHRTARFIMSIAFAFSSYLANRHSDTATADLEATIDELDAGVA